MAVAFYHRMLHFLTLSYRACGVGLLLRQTPAVLVDGMQEMLQRQDLWLLALLFGWVSLIFAFVGGAIPSLLVQLAGDDIRAASLYTDIIYPVVVNSTFCYSPIIGYVIDHYGFKMVFVACIVLVQLMIALLLVPSLQVQLVTFIVFAMAQSCLYALQFAYIRKSSRDM